MARVTGIGGVFYRSTDPAATRAWYAEHLGIDSEEYGKVFSWADDSPDGATVWSPHDADTDYFGDSGQAFMINFRVDDLDALLTRLEESGIPQVGEIVDEPYGRFAWIHDIDGFRVELWQPPR